jgi:hypothetical protein
MKKIKSILFRTLPNAAHYNFCVQVSDMLSTAGTAVLAALGEFPARFHAQLDKESALMAWVKKSAFTAEIAAADHRIDRALVAFNALVRAKEYSLTPDIAEAAHRMRIMCRNYGTLYNKSYDEENGGVYVILEHLTGAYAADVALLGLGDCVTELQGAYTEFQELLARRTAELIHKPGETFVAVRRAIEAEYHQIVTRVNAGALLNISPDFAAFIDTLNPQIERLNAEFHRVRRNIAAADPAPIPPQTYTGEPLTPMPEVYFLTSKGEVEKLTFSKDYNLTYRHNKNVGNAECIIHGKGLYYGHKTSSFNIMRDEV